MRKKLASFFGWTAFWTLGTLAVCMVTLPYVGVYITYVCLLVGGASLLLWWLFSPKEES